LRRPATSRRHGHYKSCLGKVRFDFAERNFVVALADDRLSIDDEWCRFVAKIWENCEHPPARFVPFQLSENAWPLDVRLKDVSFAGAHLQSEGDARNAFVVRDPLLSGEEQEELFEAVDPSRMVELVLQGLNRS
jgi:hypothetical protein